MDTFSFIVDLIFSISRYIWNVGTFGFSVHRNLKVPKGLHNNGYIRFYGTFEFLVHLVSRYI